jgi:hypothetical protein
VLSLQMAVAPGGGVGVGVGGWAAAGEAAPKAPINYSDAGRGALIPFLGRRLGPATFAAPSASLRASKAAGWRRASAKVWASTAAAPTARLRPDAPTGPPRLTLTFHQLTAASFHPHHRPGPSRDDREANNNSCNNQDGRQDVPPSLRW